MRLAHELRNYAAAGLSVKTTLPVSSRDLRFERMSGQPPETASMNFEPGASISWAIVSFTAPSTGSKPFGFELGLEFVAPFEDQAC